MTAMECPDGGEMTYIDDEYGSLSSGGSYEIYNCSIHGYVYIQLPD